MSILEQLIVGWMVISIMMTILWYVQRALDDAGVVDVGWAAGLGILALLYSFYGSGTAERRLLIAILGAGWSFRLALYLLKNRVIGKEEDGRYQVLRANWGENAQRNFFVFFQVQGILDVILSVPFLVLLQNTAPEFSIWEALGIGVWVTAICGESIADWQLARFRANPENRGKTCREGLWRVSRHPNYFFEWLHWLSYVAMAVGVNYGWITLVSPALILFFILKVTGIPPTEARALQSRGEDYRRYQETTSAFFPWFPKEERQ